MERASSLGKRSMSRVLSGKCRNKNPSFRCVHFLVSKCKFKVVFYLRNTRVTYLSTKTEPQPSTSQDLKVTNRLPLKDLRNAWGRTASPAFDVAKMKYVLDHDNHEMRDQFREFIKQPLFQPRFDLTLEEEREVALQRLKACCDGGFISVLDFKNNPLKVFAAHELAVIDPAMGTKMTVQFNLFGGTVLKLGTERHHNLLPGIGKCLKITRKFSYWRAKRATLIS